MVWQDPKSLAYGITSVFTSRTQLKTKTWRLRHWFDQGAEGACTGFATGHWAAGQPNKVRKITDETCRELYLRAQRLDPFPGGSYPGADPYMEGSTVLAAVKAAKERGWVKEYRWAFSVKDLALAICNVGPAILGVPWYEGMYKPAACGHLHPTGERVGGHAIACIGFNKPKNAFLVHNSWGPKWGEKGRAWVHWDDMKTLLKGSGDACIPTKVAA
jgi:hypothetical protein